MDEVCASGSGGDGKRKHNLPAPRYVRACGSRLWYGVRGGGEAEGVNRQRRVYRQVCGGCTPRQGGKEGGGGEGAADDCTVRARQPALAQGRVIPEQIRASPRQVTCWIGYNGLGEISRLVPKSECRCREGKEPSSNGQTGGFVRVGTKPKVAEGNGGCLKNARAGSCR